MAVEIVVAFVVGGFVGTFFGMIVVALGMSAKRNASHIPEVPIVT